MSRTQIDSSLVPSAQLAAQNLSNILDNAGFEIWQRGFSFSNPASGVYCADRWQVGKSVGTTVNITKETTIISSGTASIKVDTTVASGLQMYVIQNIENYQDFQGKTVTYSCRVRTSTANKIRLAMADGVTQTFSSYHSGGGTFETLTMTFNVSASATNLACYVGMVADPVAVSTFYADSAMLVMGSTTPIYIPTPPQVDLARCQRYFWRAGQTNGVLDVGVSYSIGHAYTTTLSYGYIQLPVTMRVAPTVTFVNPTLMQVHNASGGNIATTSMVGFGNARYMQWTATVSGGLVAGNATALETQNTSSAPIDISADI